ncbi:putative phospholipase C [Trichoderma atroviride IMI 206040]|uniref:Phospholipase C n=1 Tax=Hypocrea atroviridis (strain ATCC 20476 / IMI 206040) TaxID=452589 RepID=G9NVB6_HYPAI|nr:putative phospholipase C [Trichoderma atroviride IMI 206040]EHK44937.1 putative phospholipase C [Trichoderma atroviride IMI 206040]
MAPPRGLGSASATLFSIISLVKAGSLKDIDHVVLFMQENRAFDHYFGTMAGVRGFSDANLQMNDGVPVWKQITDSSLTTAADYVSPWYINYLGGNWTEATQCMLTGTNSWYENHAAWNDGTNDHWAVDNSPYSIGFYKQQDIPIQWALADNFVVGDMYQEGVVAATNPNRVTWLSGSINAPGGPQTPSEGGNPYIDNNITPGCESGGFNCYPLKWKTVGEFYEDAGTTWQVFQDADNFDDNSYARFEQFQNAAPGSSLYSRGMKGLTLDTFYAQAANGTLPEVSYIVAPMELSEHPPYSPHDGAWLQYQVAQAVLNSPKYNKTALIVSYDETGGWFDHVDPYRSPNGTAGEWIQDPYGQVGYTFIGPGFRLPFYIVSPWTRSGGVFTAHSDHNSQIMFVEKWQAAKGRNVTTDQMVPWRRSHMSDLTDAFDFDHPDYTIPFIPQPQTPHTDSSGNYDGSSYCQSRYGNTQPPVPYTGSGVIDDMTTQTQQGFKAIRGTLTEGRHLVLELNGFALAQKTTFTKAIVLGRATSRHDNPAQRWIAHAVVIGGTDFTFSDDSGRNYICASQLLCSDPNEAVVFTVTYTAGRGYVIKVKGTQNYLSVGGRGTSSYATLRGGRDYWQIYSVSY